MAKMSNRKKIGSRSVKKFLIVTEGKKTESNYLRELVNTMGIGHKVDIAKRNNNSDPMAVYRAAEKQNKEKEYPKYIKVFCVIDRDEHDTKTFKAAVNKMRQQNFKGILSVPCIEYWFLLHYKYTTSPLSAKGCEKLLKNNHIPNYEKNMDDLCKKLEGKISDAKKNAKAAIIAVGKHGNPTTEIHLLIEELEKLNK